MILTVAAFAQLAAACGPGVHAGTLAAIARTESGFRPYAIGDNTTGRRYFPASAGEAAAIAADLVGARGHSVDLGLMQVNSANLARLGLSVADAFDPCRNIAAGARVLADGYRPGAGADPQPALLEALSRYNTGSPSRGFANGYVARVQSAAEEVVPAIRLHTGDPVLHGAKPPPQAPPTWDVYRRAKAGEGNGALVYGHAAPPSPQARPSPPTGAAPAVPGPPAVAPLPADRGAPHVR